MGWKEEMRKSRDIFQKCLLLLALLQITAVSSANNTTSATNTTTTSAPTPLGLRYYLTRPADITVAVGEPAEFRCGVPKASPNLTFTLYRSHNNYSLTCPDGHINDILQALYGRCSETNKESLAVLTLKGTSFPDNGTRVVCQHSESPDALVAVLHVYDNGTNYAILIGCTIGGFFGALLVAALAFMMLRRSETLQECFRGKQKETEDDMDTIVEKN